jgi:hypothetical protein
MALVAIKHRFVVSFMATGAFEFSQVRVVRVDWRHPLGG